MDIKRDLLNKMFEANWCIVCGKNTEMKYIQTGMPGIQAKECQCGACFQINYLEDVEDVLGIPDTSILMSVNDKDDSN